MSGKSASSLPQIKQKLCLSGALQKVSKYKEGKETRGAEWREVMCWREVVPGSLRGGHCRQASPLTRGTEGRPQVPLGGSPCAGQSEARSWPWGPRASPWVRGCPARGWRAREAPVPRLVQLVASWRAPTQAAASGGGWGLFNESKVVFPVGVAPTTHWTPEAGVGGGLSLLSPLLGRAGLSSGAPPEAGRPGGPTPRALMGTPRGSPRCALLKAFNSKRR